MTSREHVLAALNHREPERVPVDLSGHRSSGIAALTYPRLRQFLHLPVKPVRVYDVIQQLAVVDEDVLGRFGVDTIELGRGFALRDDDWRPWVLPDGTECFVPAWTRIEREEGRWIIRSAGGTILAHMPDGALYFEQTYFPLAGAGGPATVRDALSESMWTAIGSPPGPVDTETLRAGAEALRGRTDRAIIGLFGGNLFEIGHRTVLLP
jgi:uroporphyrinogen decarboxylase